MSAQTLILIMGGLLVLTAIIGGGLEVKEIKIPKIGGWTRTLAGIVGAVLVVLGVGMSNPPADDPNRRLADPDANTPTAVVFYLRDELGEDQVSEQVRVLIDGSEVGTLTVNEHFPRSRIAVTVPSAGRYSYVLEATAVFRGANRKPYTIVGAGQGNISVSHGKTFELASTVTGDTWMAHVQEVRE